MKVLPGVAAGLVIALGLIASGPAEVHAQLEAEGLAIYGTVMVPGTREPVSRVRVRLAGGPDRQFFQAAEADPNEVDTDAAGRFGFTGLEPGTYRVQMPPPEGQGGFAPLGREVRLSAEGVPPDVRLWKAQTSRISGRVADAGGNPVAGAVVWSMKAYWFDGRRTLENDAAAGLGSQTDEDGLYTVTVSPDRPSYLMVLPGADQAFPAQYYPGVARVEDALPVSVPARSAELGGFDIRLVDTGQTRLRFRLPLPEFVPGITEPVSSFLEEGASGLEALVWPVGAGQIVNEAYEVALEDLGEDVYLTAPLLPGEYELELRYPFQLFEAWRRHLGTDVLDWRLDPIARVRVTVDPNRPDLQPDGSIDLRTIPPIARTSISGRVTIRDPSAGAIDPDPLPTFFLRVAGPFRLGALSVFPSFSANGAFEFEGVHPDVYAFFLASNELPEDWYVQSVGSGTRDVLWSGLEVGGAALPIEVVLASDGARISGVVRDDSGQLVADARIILIPPTGSRGPMGRLPSATADASGAYSLSRVPPGNYRMLAVDPAGLVMDYPTYEDPEFLREYELRGELITVDPGARLTINAESIPIYP